MLAALIGVMQQRVGIVKIAQAGSTVYSDVDDDTQKLPQTPKLKRSKFSAPTKGVVLVCKIGAGEGIRTLDPDLGKVVLYH